MHAGAPDMAARFARQGVIHRAGEDLRTARQQEAKDTVAEVIEIPAGLAEEPMKRAVVVEAAEAAGLNDAGEGPATRAENPGAGQRPEGGETGLSKAGLQGEPEGRKGADDGTKDVAIAEQGSVSFVIVASISAAVRNLSDVWWLRRLGRSS
jgi:hypothetical protein